MSPTAADLQTLAAAVTVRIVTPESSGSGVLISHRGNCYILLNVSVGEITLILSQPLGQGYQLGYTNDLLMGMSGGPIINAEGLLMGISGRLKDREPAFGAYAFADDSQPPAPLLDRMRQASWGIPIAPYLESEDFIELNGLESNQLAPQLALLEPSIDLVQSRSVQEGRL